MTLLWTATQMFKKSGNAGGHGPARQRGPFQAGCWRQVSVGTRPGFGVYAAFFLRSSMRQTKGVKIICMASSILPPGTTMVLARLMKLPSIMLRR